jgi:hypothetical protein
MKAKLIMRGLGTGLLGAGLALGCNHADTRSASAMPSRTDIAARMPGSGTGATNPTTANKPASGPGDMQVASNKAALDPSATPLAIPGKVDMPKEEPVFPSGTEVLGTPTKDPQVQPAAATEDKPSPTPTPAPKAPWETSVASPMTPSTTPEEIRPASPNAANPNYGHADDYSWVMGQLQYSRIHNTWRLRYAPLDETDPYGGSVTLADDLRNAGFHDGQFVRIDGRLIDANGRSIAPTYEVDSIRPTEK